MILHFHNFLSKNHRNAQRGKCENEEQLVMHIKKSHTLLLVRLNTKHPTGMHHSLVWQLLCSSLIEIMGAAQYLMQTSLPKHHHTLTPSTLHTAHEKTGNIIKDHPCPCHSLFSYLHSERRFESMCHSFRNNYSRLLSHVKTDLTYAKNVFPIS